MCRGHALANQMAAANSPPGGAAHRPSGDLPGGLPAGFRLPEAGPNLPAFRLPWQLQAGSATKKFSLRVKMQEIGTLFEDSDIRIETSDVELL